jgi:hypothetical protein
MNMNTKVVTFLTVGLLAVPLLNNTTNAGEESKMMRMPVGFYVVDGTGRVLGPVIGTGTASGDSTVTNAVVAIDVKGTWVPIHVSRNQLELGSDPVYFETANCSGQAFGFPNDYSPFAPTRVAPPGATVYLARGSVQNITLGSLYEGNTCVPVSGTLFLVPMTPVFDLTVFTPPFTVVPSRLKLLF